MLRKVGQALDSRWLPWVLSSICLLAYGGLLSLDWRYGTLRAAQTPYTVAWYLLAFIAYLGLLLCNERQPLSRRWLWGGAILFRVILLFTTPTLSDDVYRYIWDGHVANAGVSPYFQAIDAPELDYLDVPQRALANNAWMASPYLPAAQAIFFGITAVFPLDPFYMQAAMIIFDLGTAWILAKLLALAALPARRLTIYLWNPLVIGEVAHGAHIDVWMMLLTVAAIYLALPRVTKNNRQPGSVFQQQGASGRLRWIFSPLLLALGTLTKLLPALLLPVFFWLWSWPQRILYALLVLILLLPFGLHAGWGLTGALDGRGVFGAIRIYASQWQFNGGLVYWLEVWLRGLGAAEPLTIAKGIAAFLLLMLLTAVWVMARSRKQPRSILRLMSLPLIAYLLLTPTFHPWYLLPLLVFVPFLTPTVKESNWIWLAAAPWIYLSGALIFSYLAYLDPRYFRELAWVRLLEWLPVLLLLFSAAGAYLLHRYRKETDEGRRGSHVDSDEQLV